VLAHATGLDDDRIARSWKEKGDLGLVAEQAIVARRQKPLESTPLTTAKVYEHLDAIAREAGEGSQDRKIRLLSDLLGNATPREAKYIVRMVVGQMRLGVADMTIVDALASTFATKADRDRVERAYNVSSDLGEVTRVLASRGIDGLEEIHLKPFRPIRAMLAERLETLEEIFTRMEKAALEYKYDGLRVQAHVSPKKIELFSRHLENTTGQFPEIVEGLRAAIHERAAIIEGEAVPVDPNTGERRRRPDVSPVYRTPQGAAGGAEAERVDSPCDNARYRRRETGRGILRRGPSGGMRGSHGKSARFDVRRGGPRVSMDQVQERIQCGPERHD
ncbi:MAG: hypothetical protein E6K08_04485, partial [Methanobacteriota archaeon]